jgi:hypothetical protein
MTPERAKLRAEGWDEAQANEILMRRAAAGTAQQPAGGAPAQGPMSGVLGNVSAVVSHATAAIPVLEAERATLFNPTAPAKSRARSFVVLAFAAVIAAALGFVIYQEWQIHVVNAPITAAGQAEQAAEQAASAHAQSCEAQFRVAFGNLSKDFNSPPSVALDFTQGVMKTNGIRKLVRECSEYFTKEQLAAVDREDAEEKEREEHKQQRAEAAALGYNDDGSKSRVQEDVTLKSFGLQRTGADDDDKRLICIAEVAWVMVEERHIQRNDALKIARDPSSESDVTQCVEINRRNEQLGAIDPNRPVSALNPPLSRINELAAQAFDPDSKIRANAARTVCSDTALRTKLGDKVGCPLR